MLDKLRQSKDGSTLIFVLFIMLIAMLIASTVSFVILKSLQSSTDFSEAVRAHYAAESLAERSLYYIQAQRLAKTYGVTDTVADVNAMTETLSNSATASIVATVTDNAFTKDLAQYQTQQYDIYGEDTSTTPYHLAPLTDLQNIQVNWTESSGCTLGASQVEVGFSSWTSHEWIDISDPTTITTHYVYDCTSGPVCSSSLLGVDDTHLYKVFVKPLNCAVTDAYVTAFSSTGTIDTQSQINLVSTGTFGHSAKTESVTTMWNAPLSDYFNFVLFSEDQLTK